MERWNYEEITFNDCVDTSQAVEKYAFYKKSTPKEFVPCLDWWFFAHITDHISHDLYDSYREALKMIDD